MRTFAARSCPISRDKFCFRTDDLMAYWHAVRIGIGIGIGIDFVSDYLAHTDADVIALLPMLKIPSEALESFLVITK